MPTLTSSFGFMVTALDPNLKIAGVSRITFVASYGFSAPGQGNKDDNGSLHSGDGRDRSRVWTTSG
jgi:hypothetical protein